MILLEITIYDHKNYQMFNEECSLAEVFHWGVIPYCQDPFLENLALDPAVYFDKKDPSPGVPLKIMAVTKGVYYDLHYKVKEFPSRTINFNYVPIQKAVPRLSATRVPILRELLDPSARRAP